MTQLTLDDWAAKGRDAGMALAELAETMVQPDFSEAAYAAICKVARSQREVHVDDVLRVWAQQPRLSQRIDQGMNKKTKADSRAGAELVEIYTRDGMKGVEPLARRYGVGARHVANIASDMGIRRQPNRRQTEQDPRWSWAIERGAVRA